MLGLSSKQVKLISAEVSEVLDGSGCAAADRRIKLSSTIFILLQMVSSILGTGERCQLSRHMTRRSDDAPHLYH